MIRDMKFADIPAVVRLLLEAHERSVYVGKADMDVGELKRLLGQGIGRHGHLSTGGCWVQVADNDGIDGLIYGTLHRVCAIYNKLYAIDLFWLTNDHAQISDDMALLQGFLKWAKSSPHVIEVQSGQTLVIGDREKQRRLLGQHGLEDYGTIHRLEFGEREWAALSAA